MHRWRNGAGHNSSTFHFFSFLGQRRRKSSTRLPSLLVVGAIRESSNCFVILRSGSACRLVWSKQKFLPRFRFLFFPTRNSPISLFLFSQGFFFSANWTLFVFRELGFL